jgi:hypothetical protein
MYKISTRMSQALQESHRPIIVVKVKTVRGEMFNVPITQGSVSIDSTSQDARRTISFTVSDTVGGSNDLGLVPTTGVNSVWKEALQIYGNHIYAYRGVLWNPSEIGQDLWDAIPPLTDAQRAPANGAYEIVPVGVFRLNTVEVAEQSDGNVVITCQGTDVSHNIGMNHWIAPVTVWKTKYSAPVNKTDTGTEEQYIASTVLEAIKILIRNRWPSRPSKVLGEPVFDFQGVTDAPLASPVIMGSRTVSSSGSNSPWTDITALADAVGATLYIDVDGRFVLRPVPDPNAQPVVWKFLDGQGGLLLSADRKISDSKSVNYVIATGENTGAKTPLKAVAVDDDPNSPTYWQGDFGISVGYEPGRRRLTTQAETQLAANTYLNWFVGGEETLTVGVVPNPALDAGDVVAVRRHRIGIFDDSTVYAVLNEQFADTKTALKTIKVATTTKEITAGTTLLFYTDYISDSVVVTQTAPIGSTELFVSSPSGAPYVPNAQYGQQTPLVDPTKPSDGSVNYYIDQITVPLDLTTPMQITMRQRRVGSRQDAIRIGEYDVAGLD